MPPKRKTTTDELTPSKISETPASTEHPPSRRTKRSKWAEQILNDKDEDPIPHTSTATQPPPCPSRPIDGLAQHRNATEPANPTAPAEASEGAHVAKMSGEEQTSTRYSNNTGSGTQIPSSTSRMESLGHSDSGLMQDLRSRPARLEAIISERQTKASGPSITVPNAITSDPLPFQPKDPAPAHVSPEPHVTLERAINISSTMAENIEAYKYLGEQIALREKIIDDERKHLREHETVIMRLNQEILSRRSMIVSYSSEVQALKKSQVKRLDGMSTAQRLRALKEAVTGSSGNVEVGPARLNESLPGPLRS